MSGQANATLHLTSALGALTVLYGVLSLPRDFDPALRRALLRASAWALTLVAWPVMWSTLMSGCATAANAAFWWPYVIMAIDTQWSHALLPNASTVAVQVDPGIVCSMCWMLAGLVGATEQPARAKMFVVALVTYVLFVVPKVTHDDVDSDRAVLVEASQRAVFACVTALLVGAVVFDGKCTVPAANAASASDPGAASEGAA